MRETVCQSLANVGSVWRLRSALCASLSLKIPTVTNLDRAAAVYACIRKTSWTGGARLRRRFRMQRRAISEVQGPRQ